jgi:hypothetical protein
MKITRRTKSTLQEIGFGPVTTVRGGPPKLGSAPGIKFMSNGAGSICLSSLLDLSRNNKKISEAIDVRGFYEIPRKTFERFYLKGFQSL